MKLDRTELNAIYNQVKDISSRRARIMESLRLILDTLKISNGYTQDVCEVSYNVKGWKDKAEAETPVIYIIDDTTHIVRHAGCIREYVWTIRLYGLFRQGGIIDLEQWLSNVEQCILDNTSMAGQVNKTEVVQIVTDNQLFSVQNETHLFEMVLNMEYTRKYDDPA